MGLGIPVLNMIGTRIGFQWQFRSLDENSEGYVADPADSRASGSEYELGSYLRMSL